MLPTQLELSRSIAANRRPSAGLLQEIDIGRSPSMQEAFLTEALRLHVRRQRSTVGAHSEGGGGGSLSSVQPSPLVLHRRAEAGWLLGNA